MVLNPSKPLYIIGRFPPPYDGQTILTRRLETLLEAKYEVHRVSSACAGGEVSALSVSISSFNHCTLPCASMPSRAFSCIPSSGFMLQKTQIRRRNYSPMWSYDTILPVPSAG